MAVRVKRPAGRRSAVFLLILGLGIPVLMLPLPVNAVAYLAGMEGTDTFHPVSHGRVCHKGNCHTITNGYLDGSGSRVMWGEDVPLGQPITVRVPVWGWALGHDPITGNGQAYGYVIIGLGACALAALFLVSSVKTLFRPPSPRRGVADYQGISP